MGSFRGQYYQVVTLDPYVSAAINLPLGADAEGFLQCDYTSFYTFLVTHFLHRSGAETLVGFLAVVRFLHCSIYQVAI